ncbi:hypothetical protein EGW08_018249, partial [Elysia chlorotica]
PRQTKAQEDIDGVTARHVANRVIRVLLLLRCRLAGEQVRQAGTQCHKRYGRHRGLQANQAAEDGRQVADDGRQETDHCQGDEKREPASPDLSRRDDSKDHLQMKTTHLPTKGEKMHEVVKLGGALYVAAVDVHGVCELLAPGGVRHADLVQVGVGQVHDAAHHALEL